MMKFLCWLKINSITLKLISIASITTILNEKDKYEKKKDNLRSEKEKYEIMRLSSINAKI